MKYVQIKILLFSSGPLLGLTSPPALAVLRSDVCSPAVVMLSGYRCYCVLPPCWEQVCVCVYRTKDISVTTRGRPKQRIPGVSQMDFIPTPCVCACACAQQVQRSSALLSQAVMFSTRRTWDLSHPPCLQELWKQDVSLDGESNMSPVGQHC